MRIHFTWINWSLKHQKEYRKRISEASGEQERKEIAKHLGFDNAFLIRRNKDPAFGGLIYYRILSKKEIYRKILPKISEILAREIMYEDQLMESLSRRDLKSFPQYFFDSKENLARKIQGTNEMAMEYLRALLQHYIDRNDYENIINVQSYLKEYSTSRFYASELFRSNFVYSGELSSNIYDLVLKSFLIEKQHCYALYDIPDNLDRQLKVELSSLFAYPLKEKLRKLAFQILEVEKTPEILIEYPTFINHLLSIASMMYFTDLTLEEKLKLLNEPFEVDQLISLLTEYNYEWNFLNWKISSSCLINAGLQRLALEMNKIILKNHLGKINDGTKFYFYDGIATICRNLGINDKALEYYQEAFNWVEVMNLSLFELGQENIEQQLDKSKEYYKAICLKNMGEVYGQMGSIKDLEKKFAEVEEIIPKLKNLGERYHLYINLSIASKRLFRFEKERVYLNKALDRVCNTILTEEIDYIELRTKVFNETEMSLNKLKEKEVNVTISNLIGLGDFLFGSFSFKMSVKYLQEALQLSEENSIKKYLDTIYLKLAISFFYLRDWENSCKFLKKLFSMRSSTESELYYFIVLYLIVEKSRSKEQLIKIYKIFKEKHELIRLFV